MTAAEKKSIRAAEQLKDRRAYRATLIERRASIDGKIEKVEAQIKKLRGEASEEKEAA